MHSNETPNTQIDIRRTAEAALPKVTVIFPRKWAIVQPEPNVENTVYGQFALAIRAFSGYRENPATMDNRLLDVLDAMQRRFNGIDFVGTINKSSHHVSAGYPFLIVRDEGIRAQKVTILYASGVTVYSPGDHFGKNQAIDRKTQLELVNALREFIAEHIGPQELLEVSSSEG